MKAVFVLAAVCIAAVFAFPTEESEFKFTATADFLLKQKNVLRLLWRVQETNTFNDQVEVGKTYKLEDDIDSYTNKEAVKEFLIQYKKGFLPKGDLFSVYYEPHRFQMIKLFEVFFYAKDFETFYKFACFARDRFNTNMFVYAYSVAVYHRADTNNIVLPPYYELFPQMFVDNEVMYKAHQQYFHYHEQDGKDFYIPKSNYTEFWYDHDMEQRVNYFREDVGINMFNKFYSYEYPFWMDSAKYGLTMDRKGELFYWFYQQFLARYEAERLANYLPETEAFSFVDGYVKHGYSPMVSYYNGIDFPLRPDNMKVHDLEDMTVEDVLDFERRIRDAIDNGFFYDREGVKYSLKDYKGIDYLGKMIEGFPDFPSSYYGKFTSYAYSLLSHIVDPTHSLGVAPSVLEYPETATSDPAFFSLQKTFNNFFIKYKYHLNSYKRDELVFPGVKVDSVEVDKLVTYFDDFEFDLYSMFSGAYEYGKEANFKTRFPRLNYKKFNYKFEVTSDKEYDSIVRVFLGPKFDLYGHEYTLEEKRQKFIEMDKFYFHLKSGKNTFSRSSTDSFFTMKDETPTKEFMKNIYDAVEGKFTYEYEESFDCGFPERFLLPRGRKGGMPFSLFVMVTPFEKPADYNKKYFNFGYCDSYDNKYPDTKAFGYPFDRKISEYDFNTPNMYFKDVIIFHKTQEEINKSL